MALRGKETRGTCPACGYHSAYVEAVGKNGQRIGWCAACQDKEAIKAFIGSNEAKASSAPSNDTPDAEKIAKRIEKARVTWAGAVPVTTENLAGRYIASRGLAHLIGNPMLRYRADCPHPDGRRYRAVIAFVQNAAGDFSGIHRTYLSPDGSKARVEPSKASLGPVWGGAIRLANAGPEIVLGEGLETSASAGLMLGLPAWAAISAGNLAKGIILPSEIRSVVIAADDDGVDEFGRNPGLDAARAAARRWLDDGRHVRVAKPNNQREDFNDILLTRMKKGAI